jgi:hypothetical protein
MCWCRQIDYLVGQLSTSGNWWTTGVKVSTCSFHAFVCGTYKENKVVDEDLTDLTLFSQSGGGL